MTAESAVRCRTLGHSWDPIPVTKPPSYGVAIDLRCEHCYTVRRDVVSRYSGALISRRYDYEADYRDAEHLTRSDWRGRWISSLEEHLAAFGAEEEPDAPETPPVIVLPTRGDLRPRRRQAS